MAKPEITKLNTAVVQIGLVLLVLWIISLNNYLFFHTLIEVVTVIISLGIFTVAWNSRRFLKNHYYLFIGISFLAIGIIDLLHAFSYKGVGILEMGNNSNTATQLWLAGRYLTSLSFLAAPLFIQRKLNYQRVLILYVTITIFLLATIFYWKIFPVTYVEGAGLTTFKIISEYVISVFFLLSLVFLYRKKGSFDSRAFYFLEAIIIFMIISELLFTLYVGVYDFFNMFGHLLRFVAFYLSYLVIVELGLMKPYRILFKELKDSQKYLEFEKNKLAAILDSMTDGVYMTNKNFELEYCNPALIKAFGPVNEYKCYQYLHNREEPCPWCKNEEVFKGKSLRWEGGFSKNGRIYDLMDLPIKTGNEIKAKLEIFHDITERKEMERAKDEFITLASHQLRTPLASISLSAELLLRGASGEVADDQKEYLKEISRSVKNMSILVSNLLNVSRMEMGVFCVKPETLDMPGMLNRIVDGFKMLADEKKVQLEKNIERDLPAICFDGSVLKNMTENLISNAIRYTSQGGRVLVEAKADSGHIVVAVADSGCGIPQNQQDKIFTKFFRSQNARELTSEGTGLGLYMVKLMAEETGSKIWFESELERGSTFFLSIPSGNPSKK